jgi:hypothetical protein
LKRYLYYDPETGVIVHTHQEYVAGSEEFAEPDEETEAAIFERIGAPSGVRRMVTDEPPISSFSVIRRVDVKTGALVTERIDESARRR